MVFREREVVRVELSGLTVAENAPAICDSVTCMKRSRSISASNTGRSPMFKSADAGSSYVTAKDPAVIYYDN